MTASIRAWARWAHSSVFADGDAVPPPGAVPSHDASAWRLEPLLFGALARCGDARAEALRPAATAVTAPNLLRLAELAPTLRALTDAGVPYVVYKGAAVVHERPALAALRAVSDTDVLVERHRFADARRALLAAGFREYRDVEPVSIVWNNERLYIRPAGERPELHIDLHDGLHRRPVFDALARDLVRTARPVRGVSVPTTSLALLAIAAHRAKHGYTADARELLDFRLMLDELDERELRALPALAREYDVDGALYVAWLAVDEWFGGPDGSRAVLDELARGVGWRRRWLDSLAQMDSPVLDDKPWRRAPFLQLYAPLVVVTRRPLLPVGLAAVHVGLRLADVAVAGPHAVGHLPEVLHEPVEALRRAVKRTRRRPRPS